MPALCRFLIVSTCAARNVIGLDAAPPLAFPEAQGAGRFTRGGRGGQVVHVTNLNRAGPGSLAEAVSGPNRIVVFDVSGIIDLAENGKGGKIAVEHPNITIAGQSAPGEGICLRGGALEVSAPEVVVRHLRIRRGYVSDGDMGDALTVKPKAIGEKTTAEGRTAEQFEQIRIKKIERGLTVKAFADIDNIVIDHCSTSWATDENLTVTHAGHSTISYCIAAEGLDYANPRQTPPNHSEGGLWGSAAPDGRSTLHHVLYAHNRLRNPRTTAGSDTPPVLTMFNSVVYNWSEYPTHTGSERVFVQWVNNCYLPGPDTPADIRGIGFQFHGDPGARVFARGNLIEGSPAATADNRLAVSHNRKFRDVPPAERAAMIVGAPFAELPDGIQPAAAALQDVLDHAGATLPARDPVDWRIVEAVRTRGGRVIPKETDLAPGDRWPEYRSLPAPTDTDGDGMPDFWETQFGLAAADSSDGSTAGAGGYTNVEHYLNNSDPRMAPPGGAHAAGIVHVSAIVSRADAGAGRAGRWRVTRTGPTANPLPVRYQIGGDAVPGRDFVPLSDTVTIPAGKHSAEIALVLRSEANSGRTAVLSLEDGDSRYFRGCPAQSLVVIQR